MRLSVIIPTLNEESTIADLLGDLAPLREKGHEVILVDGGSMDRTLEIAGPRVDRVIQSAGGRALQMNAGARDAGGDILWFLHADTRVPGEAADILARVCTDGGIWGRFDVSLSGPHWLLRLVSRMMNLRSRLTGVATGDQGIFVRRETFRSVSGFPQIPLMEDIALCKTLRRHSPPACIHRPRLQTSSRRWEQQGIIATVVLMWRLRLAYAFGSRPQDLAKRYR
jgi:rSAM/selenodomain-associated transferase 2